MLEPARDRTSYGRHGYEPVPPDRRLELATKWGLWPIDKPAEAVTE